jgi:hypothetical protein
MNEMTFDEFVERLRWIDWYYMMSEDSAAYRRGCDAILKYRKIAEENGSSWVAAFDAEESKHKI